MKTWKDLKEYLLKHESLADSKASKANKSFGRRQMWDMYINMCNNGGDGQLPVRTGHILIKNIKRDFNGQI